MENSILKIYSSVDVKITPVLKHKDMQFKNEQKKDKTFFDIAERGLEPHIFSNFSAHDLNFHGREGDAIKSKQASKRDRTLF
jgi:hypothetical protein